PHVSGRGGDARGAELDPRGRGADAVALALRRALRGAGRRGRGQNRWPRAPVRCRERYPAQHRQPSRGVMSIEVTQGSIVAVDPDELRMAATRVENAAYHASSAMAEVSAADALQRDNPIPELRDMWPCGLGILEECRAVYDDSRALADGLRLAADTYELIELRTLDLMYPNGDPGIRRRLHHLALAYPGTNDMADHLWRAWQGLTGSGLVENWAHSGAQAGAMMAIFVNQL